MLEATKKDYKSITLCIDKENGTVYAVPTEVINKPIIYCFEGVE